MISPLWDTVILALFGFLSGSIPFGYLIASAKGVDLRKTGSGNIGATNAIRVLGIGWGAGVGVLDAIKGAVPAYLALQFSPLPGIVGAAAVLGHIFSPWLRFKGGKGVATTFAVFLVLAPFPALAALGIWILLLITAGYVSIASIFSIAALPALIFLWGRFNPEISVIAAAAGCALLVAWAHRGNLLRLAAGKEPRSDLWKRLWKR
ncbi:MAG: glycerol-3-phosphate 1-O-acyltransferase PlsY [candidate division WOR-3 bacterium]|nr:glycerol-3-phosphate 1-O-acyltransferase PlsY [candidate division WOR-3 bacterium]